MSLRKDNCVRVTVAFMNFSHKFYVIKKITYIIGCPKTIGPHLNGRFLKLFGDDFSSSKIWRKIIIFCEFLFFVITYLYTSVLNLNFSNFYESVDPLVNRVWIRSTLSSTIRPPR